MNKLSRDNHDEINTINPHEYATRERSNWINLKQKGSNYLRYFGSLIGTIGTLIAISLGVLNINQDWSERPNISTSIEQIRFGLNQLELTQKLEEDLKKIEEDHEDFTDHIILNKLDKIQEFKDELRISSLADTEYQEFVIDILEEIIKKNNKNIEKINNDINDIKQQVQDSQSSEQKEAFSREAREWLEQDLEDLGKKLKQLEEVKEKVNNLLKQHQDEAIVANNKRVMVNLLVENHSPIQNGLYKTAAIRFYKDQNTNLPVLLYTKNENAEDSLINGNSFKTLKLESKKIDSSQEREYKFLTSAFDNEYSYILVVQDLNDKIWSLEGKALSFNFDVQEDILKQETLKMLKKRFK